IENIAYDGGSLSAQDVQDMLLVPTTSSDTLIGYYTNEVIDGLDGNDSISGLEGDDTLTGGLGNDTLIGGEGNDLYHYNIGDGDDVIQPSDGFIGGLTGSGNNDILA